MAPRCVGTIARHTIRGALYGAQRLGASAQCSPLVGLNCLGNDLATIGIKQITNSRTLSTFFVAVLVNRKIEPGASKSAQFRAFHISLDA